MPRSNGPLAESLIRLDMAALFRCGAILRLHRRSTGTPVPNRRVVSDFRDLYDLSRRIGALLPPSLGR
jgi:hypothetical protein